MNLTENLFVDGWYSGTFRGLSSELAGDPKAHPEWTVQDYIKLTLEQMEEEHGVIPIGTLWSKDRDRYCFVYVADEPISHNHVLNERSPIAVVAFHLMEMRGVKDE